MADFRRQTPAGELQISVAEITEAADPLGPRLETPIMFSIARFPFANAEIIVSERGTGSSNPSPSSRQSVSLPQ